MKNKFFKAINLLLVSSMLLSQSSMAFAMNTDGVANNSQPDASLVQPATDEGVATVPNVVEATEPTTEKATEVTPETKEQQTAENPTEAPKKEVAQEEPADSTAVTGTMSGFRSAVVAPEDYAYTEGFAHGVDPSYVGTTRENGKLYLLWSYKIAYTKPQAMTGQYLDKLYAYITTTKESGLGQPQIIAAKKNGATIQVPATTTSNNGDLMNSLRVVLDPKPDPKNATTQYEFTVKTPVEGIRDVYAADFYAETLFNRPNKSVFAMKSGVREIRYASSSGDPELTGISDFGRTVYVKSEETDHRLVAGDYTANNKITWLVSQMNETDNQATYPVNIAVDASQRVDSVQVHYYRPNKSSNGYVKERTETKNANLNSVTIPAGYIAQVEVKTTVTNEKVNHTLSGAELESLKADLTIQKNWQDGSKKSETYFKITGGANNEINQTVTIPANQSTYVWRDRPKFDGFDKNARRISYLVDEVPKPGYELVYSSYDEKILTYTFENKSTSTTKPVTGVCTDYGITSIDPVRIHEFMYLDGKREVYQHDGRITGSYRIPQGAQAGDYFILEIPKELTIKNTPDVHTKFFDMISNGKKIGEVFHIETDKLKFVLNANAYSENDYTGTFQIGKEIDVRSLGVVRVDGGGVDYRQKYYSGIEPNRTYFYDARNRNARDVTKNVEFKSTYFDPRRTSENCDKVVRQNATTSFKDREIDLYGGMYKGLKEVKDDYITYDILLNLDGVNGWADGEFVDHLTDTIEMYSGNSASSLAKDIQIYEVQPLRRNLSYVAGSEKQIYPTKQSGTTSNVSVRWNGGTMGRQGTVTRGRATDHINFKFSNTGNKTILIKVKMKLTPGYESKYGGYFYNYIWSRDGRYGSRQHAWVGIEEKLTSGSTGATSQTAPNRYEVKLEKVDGNQNRITNNKARFKLTDKSGQVIGDYYTDAEGRITIGGLKRYIRIQNGYRVQYAGAYYLEEIASPDGYTRDNTIYKIVIDENGILKFGKKGPSNNENQFLQPYNASQPIKFVNEKTKGYTVKVNKVDESNASLIGAKFNLRNQTGSYNLTTSDAKNLSQFVFYNLKPGQYTLTEVESPAGYIPIDQSIQFTITDSGSIEFTPTNGDNYRVNLNETERVFEISVVNKKVKTGEFSLTKVSDDNEVLAGAIFKLTPLPNGTPIEKTSNSAGRVHFAKLNPGRYRLEEKAAPDGYKKTDLTWIVEVNDQGQTTVKVESTKQPVTNKSSNPDLINFDVVNKKEKRFGFALPETGGSGVMAIKVIGLGVILGAAFLLMRKKKKR